MSSRSALMGPAERRQVQSVSQESIAEAISLRKPRSLSRMSLSTGDVCAEQLFGVANDAKDGNVATVLVRSCNHPAAYTLTSLDFLLIFTDDVMR
jgi:hypothetical protein